MNVMISDVMRHVRNCFTVGRISGDWTLAGGRLNPARFLPGEWIAITGDGPRGVYQLDETGRLQAPPGRPALPDAAWTGRIYLLNPPADFLHLCAEIDNWARTHEPALTTERLGEYARSTTGQPWQQVFADALRPFTRMYAEVPW